MERPTQQEAESKIATSAEDNVTEEYSDLAQRLRSAVAERPEDLQGHELLARSEAAVANYIAAYKAQRRVIELKGDEATASDYADLADMMVLAAGGYVSPATESVLEAALTRDPENGVSRYYMGLMMAQNGRANVALRLWEELLQKSPAKSPWVAPIVQNIAEIADLAGISGYKVPQISSLLATQKDEPSDLSDPSEQSSVPDK